MINYFDYKYEYDYDYKYDYDDYNYDDYDYDAVLWIRIRIGSVFRSFLDPDSYIIRIRINTR